MWGGNCSRTWRCLFEKRDATQSYHQEYLKKQKHIGSNRHAELHARAFAGTHISLSVSVQLHSQCGISLNDDISFSVKRIEDIREDDEYSGLRVMLEATYPPMVVPLKVDITTGDQITPREIVYEFRLLLEPRSIKILAYNLETVMAEKLETVISRGDQNTRSRDYYDIYILRKLQWQNITPDSLRLALVATAIKRNSLSIMERYSEILQTVSSSEVMSRRWLDYQSDFDYAKDILFSDICATIKEILDSLNIR